MTFKRKVTFWIQRFPPLRWGLWLAARILAPRNQIGVYGVIFNRFGQVLMAEHVFRPYCPWGLPGGWINRAENPAEALYREILEELNVRIEVKKLLLCDVQQGDFHQGLPSGLSLAYYCRLCDESIKLDQIDQAHSAYEMLSAQWIHPDKIEWALLPIQKKAIELGSVEFEKELKV